jgi:hypothetical protein
MSLVFFCNDGDRFNKTLCFLNTLGFAIVNQDCKSDEFSTSKRYINQIVASTIKQLVCSRSKCYRCEGYIVAVNNLILK